MKKLIAIPTLLLLVVIAFPAGIAAQSKPDHAIFNNLLSNYVSNGVVNYNGFQKDEQLLDDYLAQLGSIVTDDLSPQERMAFYLNLYNAWTIKLILTRYPDIESIKDMGSLFSSPWSKKIVVLENKKVSLDHIEHELLRPQFKDPRIHFAANCASKSCPPLLGEPYAGNRLEAQLEQVTSAFINDKNSNYVQGDTLYVSRIFKWYSEDFKEGALAFFQQYAKGDLKKILKERSSDIKIKYLGYDWSLNGH